MDLVVREFKMYFCLYCILQPLVLILATLIVVFAVPIMIISFFILSVIFLITDKIGEFNERYNKKRYSNRE